MPAVRKGDDGMEIARNWEDLIERKIRDAQERGVFDDLQGRGRPLDLDDNPFEGDRALGHRMLKNAGFAPPWIEMAKAIDRDTSALDQTIERSRRRLEIALRRLAALPADTAARERLRLDAARDDLRAEFAAQVAALNRKIDSFNLSVPFYWLHKLRVRPHEQLARFDAVVPRPAESPSNGQAARQAS